ncbi:MAG: hypothetical protein SO161_04705 [Treponema sp.]|nr:hypothetical protein [Treponema sp.]
MNSTDTLVSFGLYDTLPTAVLIFNLILKIIFAIAIIGAFIYARKTYKLLKNQIPQKKENKPDKN